MRGGVWTEKQEEPKPTVGCCCEDRCHGRPRDACPSAQKDPSLPPQAAPGGGTPSPALLLQRSSQVRTGEDSLLQVQEAAGSFRVAVMLLLLWQRSISGLGMVVMVLRNQCERCERAHTRPAGVGRRRYHIQG